MTSFMELLYSIPVSRASANSICWQPTSRKEFEVKSLYHVLHSPTQPLFPWRTVWKSWVPSKVAFFVWTAALDKILTTDNLRERGVIIMDWCCHCRLAGESISHLLLNCSGAQDLWNLVFSLFGVSWVMPRNVVDLLNCWQGRVGRSKVGVIWKAMPLCLMWCLWSERNSRIFKGEEKTIPMLKYTFLQLLFEWLKASPSVSFNFVLDMLDYCSLWLLL